ncbi:hypothetical protein LSAT2_004128 [Lamellibrachia satsuma]|nr:hypothetical protein LSAT2_004128 [Lamellibrachia satsuma]
MAIRINLKTIDYFKFRKMVIDGNRDDYAACSKEVKALCDCVQTILFRDEEFDDVSDRSRFDQVCSYYKQILQNKRIDPADMRIKSGWWGDHSNAYSAGKLKASTLRATFIAKAQEWVNKFSSDYVNARDIPDKIDGPGLYVFKHKEHQCFQFVGRAERVFATCAERLKAAFEGSVRDPLAALLLICMASDWDFYFIPVEQSDGDGFLRILDNDLILKHDSIWPHGLNFRLHIDNLFEVSEFRRSCIRHSWPPLDDGGATDPIDFTQVRQAYNEYKNGGGAEPNVEKPTKQQRTQRNSTSSPLPSERGVTTKHSTPSLMKKPSSSKATTSAVALTSRSDRLLVKRPTSAKMQKPRSTPTPTQSRTPRKAAAAPTHHNQRPLRRTPTPAETPTDAAPASPSASPSPVTPEDGASELSPVSPTVQALAALPCEDDISGRRRNSSTSSRGTWTIDDGCSASPSSISPERSPTSSPAKASPKSTRRTAAV